MNRRPLLLLLPAVVGAVWSARRSREAEDAPDPGSEATASAPAPARPAVPPPGELGPEFASSLPFSIEEPPEGVSSLSAQSCRACHAGVYEQWAEGAHRTGHASPRFRQAVHAQGDPTACRGCHLPLAVQHATLSAAYADGDLTRPESSPSPVWDPTLAAEGVNCAACHVRDGAVLSPRSSPGAPHPVRASTLLTSSATCAPCHQLDAPQVDRPLYDTYGEWYRSRWREAGIHCQDCHMPPVPARELATRGGHRAHHGLGSESPADPGRALTVTVAFDRPTVVRGAPFSFSLTVANTGAGHAWPTGSPFSPRFLEAGLYREGQSLHEPLRFRFGLEPVPDPAPGSEPESDPEGVLRFGADTRLQPGGTLSLDHEVVPDQSLDAGPAAFQVFLTRADPSEAILVQSVPVTLE